MRLSVLLPAIALAATAPAQAVDLSGRAADLAYISTQLPKLDPYFFAHLDRAQFQRAVDELSARVSTISDAEFAVGLGRLVAMPGDAHTQLNLAGTYPLFSLQFRWLDDGVFVTAADAA